ncbi:MAG: glycosyltransferase family 2 protein [Akkermansiaceae bacterium]
MKFIKSAVRPPLPAGELRVESMGRFGNYFFTSGWLDGFSGEEVSFEYKFAESERPITPDFSFLRPASTDSVGTRFLHLFWINGGHKLTVGQGSPVIASQKSDKGSRAARCSIDELLENNFVVFLAAIDAVERRDVWSNRLVLEMVRHCDLNDRTGYYTVALDRVGWQTLDSDVAGRLALKTGENTLREYLNFQCLCMASMDVRYLPSELKAKFIDLIERLDLSQNDRSLAHDVIRQLVRFDSDRACEFAHSLITKLDYDREELAVCLRHCYPRDSQWWIHHALMNPGLGPEQAADALNCAGTTAATQGNEALAMLSYEAALMVDPDARSVAWNAGWLWAGLGDIAKAGQLFKRIGRHYPLKSLSTRWPHVRGVPWPALPMNMERFTLPEGVTHWPRITVITPSFNQGCFIEETILSVFNQDYPNLQYIVVDGNSTDDTPQVLERYRDRLDHLIIESDKGQTEAINKGLRLADGELVAWINSDDMYAPGTLHTTALKWLETQADVIAGICIEHDDRQLMLFNRPAARNSDFNAPQLARIFKYWLKGYYFYQPEVFFSKRILDTVGLLDESLYYSMDYDLWVRFAKAGAILEVVDWPFAFFRKHESQKTANLVDCIEEQAMVRSRHYTLVPDEERSHRIQRKVAFLKQKKGATIGILTKRLGKIFSKSIQRELDLFCNNHGVTCYLGDDEKDPRIAGADAVIMLAHVLSDVKTIGYLRQINPDRLIAAWFWDNHHHLFENQEAAEAVDVILPGHALYGEYLRNDQSIFGGHMPLCVTQWARQDAAQWFEEFAAKPRNPDLYGGFVEYTFEPARTEFLHKVMGMLSKHALTILSEANLHAYFGRSEKDRFAEWCGYQTSLVLPLRNDLSQRVFDALLAGQIPLVPVEIADLDQVIPPELQESLPILRFRMKDPSSVVSAHQRALERFEQMGIAGVLARHRYALENHTFSSRINSILDSMGTIQTQPQRSPN